MYDYIITGGGGAGLSLAARLAQTPSLADQRILLVDAAPRGLVDDRTWCFWETEPGPFEAAVSLRWQQLAFYQGTYGEVFDIAPFTYKMIRGIDFYRYVNPIIDAAPNIERVYGRVSRVDTTAQGAFAMVDGQKIEGRYVFNSIPFGPINKQGVHYLDQHFRGWFVRTPADAFMPHQATLMDYRTPQHGETRFLYVLPSSAREALVEVAIFSNNHLRPAQYDRILADYLAEHWPQAQGYQILDTEMGNIPMTDYRFPRSKGRVINLGMVGGDTRASSGYTFWYIQQRITAILAALERGQSPDVPQTLTQHRHRFYDSLFLKVIQDGYYPGDQLFQRLFAANDTPRLLAFLNAQTSLLDDIRVMQTVPVAKFIQALARLIIPAR